MPVDLITAIVALFHGAVGGAIASYVAMRVAIARLQTQVALLERNCDRAHNRLDDLFEQVNRR